MAALPVILLAVGATMVAVSQIKEAKAKSTAELYNAAVAELEGKTAKQVSEFEIAGLTEREKFERRKLLREKRLTTGVQQAHYAKAGVQLLEGTPLEVMADTAAQFELDIAANRYNTQLGIIQSRYGADIAGARAQTESQFRKQMAKSIRTSGFLKAGGTLLTAGASYGLSRATVPSGSTGGGGGRAGGTGGGGIARLQQ